MGITDQVCSNSSAYNLDDEELFSLNPCLDTDLSYFKIYYVLSVRLSSAGVVASRLRRGPLPSTSIPTHCHYSHSAV